MEANPVDSFFTANTANNKKRVFIAFASEDETMRSFMSGQKVNSRTPVEFIDMSVKEPYPQAEWKERVLARIRGCAGVIVLLTKNTKNADGLHYEVETAIAERKPIRGIHVYKNDSFVPDCMVGQKTIGWNWEDITAFVDSI